MTTYLPTIKQRDLLKNRRLLVVDDDPSIAESCRLMLTSLGATCQIAPNGREAIHALETFQPTMILLDYMMPVMDGPAVFREVSRLKQDAIPVIMLTARTDNYEEQDILLREGLSAYLMKPFGLKELVNVILNVLTIHDMTACNRRLTAELQDARNHLQSLFDGITDPISTQDDRFLIQHGNSRLRLQKPYIRPEGRLCYQFHFDRETICDSCPALETLHTRRPAVAEISHNGRILQISTYPLQGETGGFIEHIKDVTESRQMQMQLAESERLAGIGTLAAGIAHELNNPLCIIMGFAQSLLKDTPAGHPNHSVLGMIAEESERCGSILKELLHYAKPSPAVRVLLPLQNVIEVSLSLVKHRLKEKHIRLEESYDDLPDLSADPKKLQQVFVNLFMNSLQSMKSHGRLTVTTRRDGNDVVICVRDTGEGISEKHLPHIFEPFFTTKKGAGFGLGLAVCRSIIESHDGTIRAMSEPGVSTTFEIRLPIS